MTHVPLDFESDRPTGLSASRQRLQVQQVYRRQPAACWTSHTAHGSLAVVIPRSDRAYFFSGWAVKPQNDNKKTIFTSPPLGVSEWLGKLPGRLSDEATDELGSLRSSRSCGCSSSSLASASAAKAVRGGLGNALEPYAVDAPCAGNGPGARRACWSTSCWYAPHRPGTSRLRPARFMIRPRRSARPIVNVTALL